MTNWEEEEVAEIIKEDGKIISYVNMDNPSLKRLLYKETAKKEIIKEQFKISGTIMALALKAAIDNGKIEEDAARTALRELGKVILPIVSTLGKIKE